MAATNKNGEVDMKLSEMFDKMLSNFDFVENSTGSTSSETIQVSEFS